MRTPKSALTTAFLMSATFVLLSPESGRASIFHASTSAAPASLDGVVTDIEQALSEQRLVDAARLLDTAMLAGAKDPRLTLLSGRLEMERGHYADALDDFKSAQLAPQTRAAALEGAGVVLSLLGRSDEAMTVLQQAVAQSPTAWRAWNALGCEYDQLRDWTHAEQAYDNALKNSNQAAIVLNNRGYSRILQHRLEDAIADLVTALQKRPDFAEARTNLRLVLAMKGDYGRAVSPGAEDDKAALLNNAGFAAALRGDYAQAEDLLGQAIKTRSVYYDRASQNLVMVKALADKDKGPAHAAP